MHPNSGESGYAKIMNASEFWRIRLRENHGSIRILANPATLEAHVDEALGNFFSFS